MSQCNLIDGRQIAQDYQKELKQKISEWVAGGNRPPCLIAIIVGDDPASKKYVENKMKAAHNVGISSNTIKLPENTTEFDVIAKIEELNQSDEVDGILVQLPVPEHISEQNVCNAVDPKKDVDGFHVTNIGRLVRNQHTFVPATALGVIELIKRAKIETFGKNIVICGRSKNVGLPMALLLHSDGRDELAGCDGTVTICHRYTPQEDLKFFARRADIIISATGVRNLIRADMVKPGAAVIDVGIIRISLEDGKTKLVGDVDFEEVQKVAGAITPVPGGVGPMTVAMLMANTFKAAQDLAAN